MAAGAQKISRLMVREVRPEVPRFAEGVIDLFTGIWTCSEHNTKMRAGRACAWCASEEHGLEVLEELAV